MMLFSCILTQGAHRTLALDYFHNFRLCALVMSENESKKGSESCTKKNYDPRLDFYSDKFDPLYALSVGKIDIPVPNAKTYDNLNVYQSAQSKQKQSASSGQARQLKPKTETEAEAAGTSRGGRRFLPHQMPVRSAPRKERSNLFTRMADMEGPLKLLKKCVDEKLKIKVWTRNAHTIRGYCTAYVTAFDKHWNLALSDVTEVWTRPKKRKTVALDADVEKSFHITKKVIPPPITILKVTKKQEVCSRKVDQYVMRGEHVVIISIVDENVTEKPPELNI